MDSDEPDRGRRFGNKLGEVLLECLFETEGLFPYVLLLLFLGFGVYLVAGMTYHLMFDPNAVDVASRLDLLSIDPGQVGTHAGSFPRTLSEGAPYAVLSSTPGNAKPIFRTASKLIVLFGMGESNYPQEQESDSPALRCSNPPRLSE